MIRKFVVWLLDRLYDITKLGFVLDMADEINWRGFRQ